MYISEVHMDGLSSKQKGWLSQWESGGEKRLKDPIQSMARFSIETASEEGTVVLQCLTRFKVYILKQLADVGCAKY